jgi:hypothetical protein
VDPDVTVGCGVSYKTLNIDTCKIVLLLCLRFHEIVMFTTCIVILLYASFWVIPRRLNLNAEVSEHSVCSIFIGR